MSNDKVQHVRKDWTVDVSIDEHEGQTRATARLRWRERLGCRDDSHRPDAENDGHRCGRYPRNTHGPCDFGR